MGPEKSATQLFFLSRPVLETGVLNLEIKVLLDHQFDLSYKVIFLSDNLQIKSDLLYVQKD